MIVLSRRRKRFKCKLCYAVKEFGINKYGRNHYYNEVLSKMCKVHRHVGAKGQLSTIPWSWNEREYG